MLKVGIIGAGTISVRHIESYARNPETKVVVIADLNENLAKSRAEEFGIKNYCKDYMDIINDKSIDVVSIVTPTFTHHDIILKALQADKHVMCEKPPCITPEDAKECVDEAEKRGKMLMWAFCCRFSPYIKQIKDYIDSGRMGKIYHAEVTAASWCTIMNGWFVDKKLAHGGSLLDSSIHRIDEAMYLMGYPKVKMVVGYSTDVNKDLPAKVKGFRESYISKDANKYERTVESAAGGYIKLENGACLFIKAGGVMYALDNGSRIHLIGEKSGVLYNYNQTPDFVTSMDDYIYKLHPVITASPNLYDEEINHFVDCILNGTECIVKPWQGIEVMKIIEGIYRSAESGEPVYF